MIKGEKSPQNASDTTSATSSSGETSARATTSGAAPPSLSDGLGVGKARVLEYLERTKAWLETPLCQFRVGQTVLYHSNAHPDDLRTGVIVDLRPDLHSRRIDLDSRKGVKRKKCRPTLQDLHRMQAGLQPILEMEKVAQAVAAERSTISQEVRTAALHVKLSEKDESLLRRRIDDELTVGLGARLKAEGARVRPGTPRPGENFEVA